MTKPTHRTATRTRGYAGVGHRGLLVLLLAVLAGACSVLADNALSDKPAQTGSTTGAGGGGGGTGGGGTCDPAACPGGSCCGDACVDLMSDPAHCGDCGTACAANEQCCGGACVDTQSNPVSCGGCGITCLNTVCLGGQCTSECVFGYDNCDGNIVSNGCEVDLSTDASHCGGCDIACPFDATCTLGDCTCPAGRLDCDGLPETGCEVDSGSDQANCGGCGKACGPNTVCLGGSCMCATGYGDCNGIVDDGCEAPFGTVDNCMMCGDACGVSSVCGAMGCGCDATHLDCDMMVGCEASKTSPMTCGACTVMCDVTMPFCDGTSCIVGCGALTLCGGACVDLMTDPSHCGDCAIAAGPHQHCENGMLVCDAYHLNCDGMPATGCETDIGSDPLNCNGCGNICKPGAVCAAGNCVCGAGTPNDCGADCRRCCTDADCSDGSGCTTDTCAPDGMSCTNAGCGAGLLCCGAQACQECCASTDCGGGMICSGGTCILACQAPEVACGGQCVDLMTSNQNCGVCGNDCLNGRTCVGGVCTPPWVTLSTMQAPAPRQMAAAAWTGTEMFVWGGYDGSSDVNTGGRYNPSNDSWSAVSTNGVPTARVLASAVWTGSHVLVWGGGPFADQTALDTGGEYKPNGAMGTWSSITTTGAPAARRMPIAVWTGSRMLIWGGVADGAPVAGGGLYDRNADSWTPITGSPSPRTDVAWAWSGTELYLYGGDVGGSTTDEGYAYNPATDSWRTLPASATLGSRKSAFGAWLGGQFLVWGGVDSSGNSIATGDRYSAMNDMWIGMGGSPPSKRGREERWHGWSGSAAMRVLIFGGLDGGTVKNDGKVYTPSFNTWGSVTPGASVDHEWGAGVWTGAELILWSGLDGGNLTPVGERYKP